MTVAELFARIGVKADSSQLNSFDKKLKGVKIAMTAAVAGAAAFSVAIRKITDDAMDAAAGMKQFEAETGASYQELQKWQSVAEQTNNSSKALTESIKNLAANREKIKLGEGDISGYQLLGIDPMQDPFEILEELRTKTKGLSDEQRKNVLGMMGVGAGMIQTLALSRDQFDAMASRSFIISPKAIETLNATKSSVDLLGKAFKYIKAQITVAISPQIKQLTRQFSNFIKVNEKGIIKGFQKGLTYVKLFLTAIARVARLIDNLVRSTVGWERAIKYAAIAFGVLNAVLFASPIGLITAGIILLIALIEDLYVYSKGGKSLFGVLMETGPMQKIMSFFGDIKDFFITLKTLSFSEIVEEFGILGAVLKGIVEIVIQLKDLFVAIFSGDKMNIDQVLDQWGILGDIIQGIVSGIQKIDELLKSVDFDISESFTADPRESKAAAAAQLALNPIAVMKNIFQGLFGDKSQPSNIDITQNVYGSTDPMATGNAAAAQLQRQLNSASSQFSRNE